MWKAGAVNFTEGGRFQVDFRLFDACRIGYVPPEICANCDSRPHIDCIPTVGRGPGLFVLRSVKPVRKGAPPNH